jgi:hypothetical protein
MRRTLIESTSLKAYFENEPRSGRTLRGHDEAETAAPKAALSGKASPSVAAGSQYDLQI